MPRKKKVDPARESAADELLLRALKQLADEALQEEIPERLLRPLREASGAQQAAVPPGPPTGQRRPGGRKRSRS